MFPPIPKWTVFLWNIVSIMSSDLNYNKWQVIFSILLIVSCIYNLYATPQFVCQLEGSCDNSLSTVIKGMIVRVVAITCLVSRIIIILKSSNHMNQYKKNIDNFHLFTPMAHSDTQQLKKVSLQVILISLLLTVPINIFRIWILFNIIENTAIFITLVYIQNLSMYCVETHFTVLCFILYQKFVDINKDLTALKIDTIIRNKYPFMSKTGKKYGKNNLNTFDHNKEVLHYLATGYPMTNFIKKLIIKHRLVREAMKNLNNLFGVHLGLSLCALCMYTMFEIYYQWLGGILNPTKSFILIFGWILQYGVRFLTITILTHVTTKQVIF